MKITISLVSKFLIFITISCGQNQQKEFPNQIQTIKTDKHIRIKGTKVFGVMPNDYKYIKELSRYQKNENLYLQVFETSSSFNQAKPDLAKQKIEEQGAKIDTIKNIKLNEFEAIYGEGPSKYQGETKLMLAFGDDSFFTMIVGVCKTADIAGKRELQEILKTIYYEKTFELNPFELVNFEFDQSITNFKYATTVSNFFIYTENGKEDLQNETSSAIQLATLPQMTEEQANSVITDMLWRYEKNSFIIENKNIKRAIINNYPAFTLETNVKYKDNNGVLYKAVLVGEKSTVLFVAITYKELESSMEKFKKTAQTIQMK
jgi:hypothetical protein